MTLRRHWSLTAVKDAAARHRQSARMRDHTHSAAPARWSVRRLAALVYPLAVGAVAINLFFLGLMARGIGLAELSPLAALLLALPLAGPAAWAFARRLRGWMDEADPPG